MSYGAQAWSDDVTTVDTTEVYRRGRRRTQHYAEVLNGVGNPAGTLTPTAAALTGVGERTWVYVESDEAFVIGSAVARNTTETDIWDGILADAGPVTSKDRCLGIAHFAIALASFGWIVRNGVAWGISDGTIDANEYIVMTNNGGAGSIAGVAATATPEAQVGATLAQANVADNSLAGVLLNLI